MGLMSSKRRRGRFVNFGLSIPHGGVRPFHQKSTCLTQLILGPYAVRIWSRIPQNYGGLKASNSTVWYGYVRSQVEEFSTRGGPIDPEAGLSIPRRTYLLSTLRRCLRAFRRRRWRSHRPTSTPRGAALLREMTTANCNPETLKPGNRTLRP